MLLKLFKSNHPFVIFIIPIMGVLLWLPGIFGLKPDFESASLGTTTKLYDWVINLFSFYPKASIILALLLLVVQSYIIIRLNFKYIFIEHKTYLPSVFFIVFASIFAPYQMLHPLLFANLFFLLALDKALLLDKSKNHFKRYYESGFFLGLGSLFYPNIYVFIVIIWLSMIYLRTFSWREWFSSILGTATPFLVYLAILYLTDNANHIFDKLKIVFTHSEFTVPFSNYALFVLGFLVFVLIIALISGARVVGTKKISTRKYFSLFFLSLLITIGAFFVHPALGYELVVILAIPLSIICSIFFTELRSKWVGEVLFTLILAAVLAIIWI